MYQVDIGAGIIEDKKRFLAIGVGILVMMRRMTFKARGGPKTDLSLEITMPRANISPADWNQLGYPIQHYIREYFNGDEHSTAREEIRSRQGILIDSWLID